MWLGHAEGRAAWHDERGERIGHYAEVVRARREAQQAREAAEQRVRELEEELRRLRGGP
jgi:hypothetical protein